MPNFQNDRCVAAIGSMTMAIKAQHALLSAGIVTQVQPLSPSETRRGCSYGLEFPCGAQGMVRLLLAQANIPVSQFLRRNGAQP